jgi:hypothetical protein
VGIALAVGIGDALLTVTKVVDGALFDPCSSSERIVIV